MLLDYNLHANLEKALKKIDFFESMIENNFVSVSIDPVSICRKNKDYFIVNFIVEAHAFGWDKDTLKSKVIKQRQKLESILKELYGLKKPLRGKKEVEYDELTSTYKQERYLSYWLTLDQLKTLYLVLKIQEKK